MLAAFPFAYIESGVRVEGEYDTWAHEGESLKEFEIVRGEVEFPLNRLLIYSLRCSEEVVGAKGEKIEGVIGFEPGCQLWVLFIKGGAGFRRRPSLALGGLRAASLQTDRGHGRTSF